MKKPFSSNATSRQVRIPTIITAKLGARTAKLRNAAQRPRSAGHQVCHRSEVRYSQHCPRHLSKIDPLVLVQLVSVSRTLALQSTSHSLVPMCSYENYHRKAWSIGPYSQPAHGHDRSAIGSLQGKVSIMPSCIAIKVYIIIKTLSVTRLYTILSAFSHFYANDADAFT